MPADVIRTGGGAISNRRVKVVSGWPLRVTLARSTYSPGGSLVTGIICENSVRPAPAGRGLTSLVRSGGPSGLAATS